MPEQIVAQLQHICDSEQVSYEPQALAQLAAAADGSMRDALSLLDQAIVYCQGKLSHQELNQMLGYITLNELAPLLKALAAKNGQQVFAALSELQKQGPDYQQVLSEVISSLHKAAVYQMIPAQQPSELIQDLARVFSAEELQLYYQIALLGQKDLPFAPSQAEGFEMILLRMLAFQPAAAEPVQAKVPASPVKTPAAQAVLPAKKPLTQRAAEASPAQAASLAASVPAPAAISALNWAELLSKLGLTGLAKAFALNCALVSADDQQVKLSLAASYKPMMSPKVIERLEQALSRHFSKPLRVAIQITEEEVQSPAKQLDQEEKNRHAQAFESIQQSPSLQKIKNLFNATLDPHSVEVEG